MCELQKWAEMVTKAGCNGHIAIAINKEEEIAARVECNGVQICLMLVFACEEDPTFKKALLAVASHYEEEGGQG